MGTFARMRQTSMTHVDYSMYSNEITEFYAKYPKYKDVSFVYLFSLMSDKDHETVDQIFQGLEKRNQM